MKKSAKEKRWVASLSVFMLLFMGSFNGTTINANAATRITPIVTISGKALTNKIVKMVEYTSNLYSSTSYDVSTADDFKSKLNEAISSCAASITLNYTGSTAFAGFPNSLGSIINSVTQTAGNDYEKLLLKTWKYSYSYPVNNAFTVTYSFTYWETPDQTSQVSDKVDTIIASIITDGMTDEQKEKAVNAYICKNVAYDTTLVQHSAYAALFGNKKTVCQGYALLAYKMLTAAGLNARVVVGTANNVGHAWNMVQIKDAKGENPTWYDLDVTWNDPLPDVAGRVRYDYFNLQDSKLIQKAHKWTASFYPSATSPYITSDSEILAAGRAVDVITDAPSTDSITIANNVGISDTVTVSGLKAGDTVKVYKDTSSATTIGTAVVAAGKTSAVVSISQLGQDSGSVYVALKNSGAFESSRTSTAYNKEPVSDVPNASIINNVDKADTITFTGLQANDVVTVYAKDGVTKLGTATSKAAGNVTVTLAKQLSETDLEVEATVTSYRKLPSPQTKIVYVAQAVTSAPATEKMLITNNAVIIAGLTEGDKILVYASDAAGTKPMAYGTVAKGNTYVVIPFKAQQSGTNLYVTDKSINKMESSQLKISTP